MDDLSAFAYPQVLQPWQSAAGHGPLLRGRRTQLQAPMLHFLHGNGFCGGVYWRFLRSLAPDYGLFVHDIEGHGESEAPARYSGTAALIERIPHVIADHLPPELPLVGIGHSFGAALTMAVAARNPGLFEALVLLDPILLPNRHWLMAKVSARLGRNPMANAALRRRDRWPSRAAAADALRGRGIYRGWREDAFADFIEHATRDAGGERVLCCPKALEAAIFGNPVYPWRLLPRVRCPVLFLYGASSYDFFPEAAAMARRRNPRIEVQTIAGGHCFMQETPESTAGVVRAFLQRHGI